MDKIKNIEEFLKEWKDIKPEKVVSRLAFWSCGSAACAGGQLVNMPYFKKLGVLGGRSGMPYLKTQEGLELEAYGVAKYLFGDDSLFMANYTSTTDHEVVTERFNFQLEKLCKSLNN